MDLYPTHDAVFSGTYDSDSDSDSDEEDKPLLMSVEIAIQDLVSQIYRVGVRESPLEVLRQLWIFGSGPTPSLKVQVTLARLHAQREGESAFSRTFYERVTKKHPAFHMEVAANMLSTIGNPWDREDIIEEFLKGASSDLIHEVPVKILRDDLVRMRDDLAHTFSILCSGCFDICPDVKLKQCTGCKTADIMANYCSRRCQRRHWHARHKDVCPVGINYRCAYCKKVSPEELKACELCDKPRYCSRDCLEKDKESHSKNCERDLKFFCSVCKVTFPNKLRFCPCDPQMFRYCSEECQTIDWADHSLYCTARHKRKK